MYSLVLWRNEIRCSMLMLSEELKYSQLTVKIGFKFPLERPIVAHCMPARAAISPVQSENPCRILNVRDSPIRCHYPGFKSRS